MSIRFGTDGWRAVIAETFTFGNLRLVAQAVADYVNAECNAGSNPPEVVVGFDTRFLSDRFAAERLACWPPTVSSHAGPDRLAHALDQLQHRPQKACGACDHRLAQPAALYG